MIDVVHGAKRKTIVRVLQKKLEEWRKTLPDELSVRVADKIVVTGGSITSLLLGEPINDFDIYLTDRLMAYDIARHYVNQFNAHKGLTSAAGPLPTVRWYLPGKIMIPYYDDEGNYIHPTPDDHIDTRDPLATVGIFIKSSGVASERVEEPQTSYRFFEMDPENSLGAEEYIEEVASILSSPVGNPADKTPTYRPVFLSQNAITLSDKIQIILRFCGDPDEIHKNFDYVHATCYYRTDTEELVLPPAALESMLSRALVYNGSLYPIASLFRMRKFLKRGWRITAGQITKMAFQISKLDLTNPNVLREQLTGVDAAYFHELIKILTSDIGAGREIDNTYIMNLIESLE